MKATFMLADFAENINGKLYIMGGGWSITGPKPSPFAIAGKLEIPWEEANQKHRLQFELLDEDGKPVLWTTDVGEKPIRIAADFEGRRPVGVIEKASLDLPIAFNVAPIPLTPGRRYQWQFFVNGATNPDWKIGFSTREEVPKK